jgi:hypothetical protein
MTSSTAPNLGIKGSRIGSNDSTMNLIPIMNGMKMFLPYAIHASAFLGCVFIPLGLRLHYSLTMMTRVERQLLVAKASHQLHTHIFRDVLQFHDVRRLVK